MDPIWKRRVESARKEDAVLRYVARVTARRIVVGVRSVPRHSPFAAIQGSDNQLVYTTARYQENPLVITGPGAGAEVTAAGVLNDILRLAGT
jgi:aspartokinase/homoserine dehydrogenase 1